jgi:hypothetical protein
MSNRNYSKGQTSYSSSSTTSYSSSAFTLKDKYEKSSEAAQIGSSSFLKPVNDNETSEKPNDDYNLNKLQDAEKRNSDESNKEGYYAELLKKNEIILRLPL